MAYRRTADRAPLSSRSYREPRKNRRFEERGQMPTELERDFAAMKRVWQMLRAGAVRMVGEVGRQY